MIECEQTESFAKGGNRLKLRDWKHGGTGWFCSQMLWKIPGTQVISSER